MPESQTACTREDAPQQRDREEKRDDADWCHPRPSSEERRDEGSTDLNANTANAQLLSRAVARSSESAGKD